MDRMGGRHEYGQQDVPPAHVGERRFRFSRKTRLGLYRQDRPAGTVWNFWGPETDAILRKMQLERARRRRLRQYRRAPGRRRDRRLAAGDEAELALLEAGAGQEGTERGARTGALTQMVRDVIRDLMLGGHAQQPGEEDIDRAVPDNSVVLGVDEDRDLLRDVITVLYFGEIRDVSYRDILLDAVRVLLRGESAVAEAEERDARLTRKEQLRQAERYEERVAELTGYSLDAKVKKATVSLRAQGIPVARSSQGGLKEDIVVPWIAIESPAEPDEYFIGEYEAFEQVAEETGIPIEEITSLQHPELYQRVMELSRDNGPTPELREWMRENHRLEQSVRQAIEEFYQDRDVDDDVRIKVQAYSWGSFRIYSGARADYRFDTGRKLKRREKREMRRRVKSYQREMKDFGAFLEKRFLDGERES